MDIPSEFVSCSMCIDPVTGEINCCQDTPEEASRHLIRNRSIQTSESRGLITTTGLSFNTTYENLDMAFDPNSIQSNGLSTIQNIETYLASWGPLVYAGGLVLDVLIRFTDSGIGILATGGGFQYSYSLSNPIIQASIALPTSYNSLNDDTGLVTTFTTTFFQRTRLKYFEFLQNTTFPLPPSTTGDILITVNSYYIKIGTYYDYSDSFTNFVSKISFKGLIIHEIHHGLGFIFRNWGPFYFRDSNIPSFPFQTQTWFMDPLSQRIYDGNNDGINPLYAPVSVANGVCRAPIGATDTSHLPLASGTNGLMEPAAQFGGQLWRNNDGNVLKILGFNNVMGTCIATDAEILMADGSTKLIQNIKRGDEVAADVDSNKTYIVSRILTDRIAPHIVTHVCELDTDIINKNSPNKKLLISPRHPIICHERKIRIFAGDLDNIKILSGKAENTLPPHLNASTGALDAYMLWDLQFDTIGSYVANGLCIQSRHPQSILTPLNKSMYFDAGLYTEERKGDDDPAYEYELYHPDENFDLLELDPNTHAEQLKLLQEIIDKKNITCL